MWKVGLMEVEEIGKEDMDEQNLNNIVYEEKNRNIR